MDMLLKSAPAPTKVPSERETMLLRAFGYTTETLELLIVPMAADGMEGLGSMGNDVPLACLSKRSRTLFDYFKQLFAQVTNPPIDPIREAIVMSLECFIGPERNILECSPDHVNRLFLKSPVITDKELAAIKNISAGVMKAVTIDCTYPIADGEKGLEAAIKRICSESSAAITAGAGFLVLSDRGIGPDRAPIPAVMLYLPGARARNFWLRAHILCVREREPGLSGNKLFLNVLYRKVLLDFLCQFILFLVDKEVTHRVVIVSHANRCLPAVAYTTTLSATPRAPASVS